MESMSENNENNTPQNSNPLEHSVDEQRNDVMHFIDAGDEQSRTLSVDQNTHQITGRKKLYEVSDMLSRPWRLNAIEYTTTLPHGTIAYFPFYKFIAENFPAMLNKYYAIKADLCFQVRCNAQPFQTGAFQVAYVPPILCPDGSGTTSSMSAAEVIDANAEYGISFVSGLPGAVYFNIASDTVATIRIPWRWVVDTMCINRCNPGVFIIQFLQPLGSKIASDFAELVPYMWIENLVAEGVTSAAIAPYKAQGITRVQEEQSTPHAPTAAQESTKMSTIASKISNVAGTLSKIPIVSDIAGPVSIAAEFASKAFSAFGFSKPVTQEPPTIIQPMKSFGRANVDGNYTGTKLSANRNQEIKKQSLGYVEEDEMSISYIVQKPSMWSAFSWNINQTTKTQLCSFRVYPGRFGEFTDFKFPGAQDRTPVQANTYLSYLAGIFKYYRGPIKLKFHVVANGFYSGRLRVTYMPSSSVPVANTPLDSSFYHAAVFDIKEDSQFEFEIPWVVPEDWIETTPLYQSDSGSPQIPFPLDMGRVGVWVENRLRTNNSCPDAIAVWMSVCGTPESQFCVPYDSSVAPNIGFLEPFRVKEEQSESHAVSFGKEKINLDLVTQAIGDPILDLRSVLKRYQMLNYGIPNSRWHNAWGCTEDDTSWFNWIGRMYGVCTGGIRLWLLSTDGGFVEMSDVSQNVYAADPVLPNNFPTSPPREIVALHFLPGDMVDFEIPFYSRTPRIASSTSRVYTTQTVQFTYGVDLPDIVWAWNDNDSQNPTVAYRAAADDYNCGLLLGPRMTDRYQRSPTETGAVSPSLHPPL